MNDPVGILVMRYAFPCAEISIRLGQITQEEYEAMEAALLVGESLPRTKLEQYFPELMRRLKEVAARDTIAHYWSLEALHAYFLKYHDEYLDRGDGMLGRMSKTEKELCRCRIGVIKEVKGEVLILEDGKRIFGKYLPGAEEGSIVVYHRRFATEQLSEAMAAEFQQR